MLIGKTIAYFPLKVILIFLIFSEVLFFVGPNNYNIDNGLLLFLYLLVLNVSFYCGYKNGYKGFKPSQKKLAAFSFRLWILAGLTVTCIGALLYLKSKGWSFSLSTLVNSLSNPGEAYYSEVEEDSLHSSNYFSVIFSPIKWAALPLGIYYWNNLSKLYKSIVLATLLISLFISLCSGVRKGLFDIILISFFCIIAKSPKFILNKKSRIRLKLVSLSVILCFLIYFIFSNISRYGGENIQYLNSFDTSNIKSFYLEAFPLPIVISLSFITGYLCQGYFALAKGLSYGIIMPSFMGSSFFLIRISNEILGHDPTKDTYMWILQQNDGIHMTINWHTLYLWLANDFTFIMVPFIIYYIGVFLARTWCDSVYGKNVFAYPTFCLFLIMSFYAFANNQVFSFSFIPFCFWFTTYYMTKKTIK